jgi:outer membrane biosynthesis protein TonB
LLFLAAVAAAALLGMGACGDGSGERPTLPSDRPTTDRTATRPPDEAQTPQPPAEPTDRRSPTRDAEPTDRPDRTEQPTSDPTPPSVAQPPVQTQPPPQTQPPAQPPAQTQPPPQPPQTVPAATQPAAPAAASTPVPATAAETQTMGDVGCLLLILLVGLVIGGLAIWRMQKKSGWDTDAVTLAGHTNATVAQLPPVLTTTTAEQRALTWPPLRAAFITLMDRWEMLATRTTDGQRQAWGLQIRGMVQDLVGAVDAENEAMAFDYDWRLLRPRTAAAEQTLASTLAARPSTGTATGGQPGVAEAQPYSGPQ